MIRAEDRMATSTVFLSTLSTGSGSKSPVTSSQAHAIGKCRQYM